MVNTKFEIQHATAAYKHATTNQMSLSDGAKRRVKRKYLNRNVTLLQKTCFFCYDVVHVFLREFRFGSYFIFFIDLESFCTILSSNRSQDMERVQLANICTLIEFYFFGRVDV